MLRYITAHFISAERVGWAEVRYQAGSKPPKKKKKTVYQEGIYIGSVPVSHVAESARRALVSKIR